MTTVADLGPVASYSDALGEAFFAVDKTWRIVIVNDAALSFAAVARDDVLGRDFWELFPLSRGTAFADLYRRAMETGRRDEIEAETQMRPGRFMRAVAVPLEDGLAITLRDVTRQRVAARQRERQLEESESRLRLALDATQLGTWDFDPQTGTLAWDAQCRAIYGLAPDAPVTYDVYLGRLHPDDRDEVIASAQRALDPGGSGQLDTEHRILRAGSGEERWTRGRGRAFFADGRPVRLIGTVLDITERKRGEEALRDSEERFRLATEAFQGGVADYDVETGEVTRTARQLEIIGETAESFPPTHDAWVGRIHPEDVLRFVEARDELVQGRAAQFEAEYRARHREGRWVWVWHRGMAMRDDTGRLCRIFSSMIDITPRKTAETALRENEERLRTIADNIPNGMVYQAIQDPDGAVRFTYVSHAVARLHGVTPAQVLADPAVLDRQVLEEFRSPLAALRATADLSRPEISMELAMRLPSGEVRWFHRNSAPRLLADGRVVWDGVEIDVTERMRSETALRESEQRLRATYEHAGVGIVETDADGRLLRVNEAICAIVGYSRDELLRASPFNLTHSDDAAEDRALYARQIAGEIDTYTVEKRLVTKDGRTVWVSVSSSAVRGPAGAFLYAVRVTQDIDARKRAEDRRSLLINELNHRVKNTLATVQSIATQTLRGVSSAERAREDIEGRLLALSRAHDVLTRESWEGANLAELVAQALAPYAGRGFERVMARGPDVRLPPRMALALAMALQELATNAAKYGALSNAVGQVKVDWSLSDGAPPRLALQWVERGGPPVNPPARRGFGSKLIERSLSLDLAGEVVLAFETGGVVCTVDVPIESSEHLPHAESVGRAGSPATSSP